MEIGRRRRHFGARVHARTGSPYANANAVLRARGEPWGVAEQRVDKRVGAVNVTLEDVNVDVDLNNAVGTRTRTW